MNVYITGHTGGLGLHLYNYFCEQGFTVFGYSRSNGFDIEQDLDRIVQEVSEGSIFVNNAYANGSQLKLIEMLDKKVSKMIVCGSIASEYPDPDRVQYSRDKKSLKELVYGLGLHSRQTKYLYISLTSSSYRDPQLVINTIAFWLENSDVIEIGYNVHG